MPINKSSKRMFAKFANLAQLGQTLHYESLKDDFDFNKVINLLHSNIQLEVDLNPNLN
jgi:hypothetical protein